MGGERKREGIATTVTDSGSVIHHPRPRPGVGVEGLVGYYDVSRYASGDNVPPLSAGLDTHTEPEAETEGGYDTTPSQLSEGDKLSMADLLLLPHHSPAAHPITGAEAWELELGETVKCAGATSVGIGRSTSGVVRTGRGRKVGGKSIEEKDEDEEKGRGKAKGSGENAEERVEVKGKAPESTKGEEEKPNKGEQEDAGEERKLDLWSVFNLDPPHSGQQASSTSGSGDASALDLTPHSTLDLYSHTTEQNISNSTEHNLTTLHIILATHQALDQRELRLVAIQERIEGVDESVREVQRAVGYHEEAIGWREKEVEEREIAVEKREREVQGREEKVMELEQVVDERGQVLDKRGSKLEERSKWVEEEMETRCPQFGGLNAPTLALGSNSWPITLLQSVAFCVLGDKMTLFLFFSCPSSSSNASPASSNPNSSTATPSSIPLQRRPRCDWEA